MKEQKKLLKIRKAINIIENTALFISFIGVMGLIMMIILAPEIIEIGSNYYGGLFASIGAILTAPALAWVEDEIKNSGKDNRYDEF